MSSRRGAAKLGDATSEASAVVGMAARSSSRKRLSSAGVKSATMSQDAISLDGEEEEYQPPAKKRKTKNEPSKRRGARGKLARLLSMPMDILFEILACLRPLDLLHLSRVNKAFRDVLMHRSSRSVWREVLNLIPTLPPCPEDVSEPSWSSLLFETRCHICGIPNAKNAHWEIRLRACDKCSADLFEPAYSRLDYEVIRALPTFNVRLGRRRVRCIYIPQADKLNDELKQFAVTDELDPAERAQKLAERRAYLEARKGLLIEAEAHAQVCREWNNEVASDRAEERNSLKALRYKDICAHLTSMGYRKEIEFKPSALLNHKLVKEPKALTPRIWKNIQDPLVNLMESVKIERLREERISRIRKRQQDFADFHREYIRNQPPDVQGLPAFGDVLALEPFKSIIEADADQDKTLDFTPHLQEYPSIIDRWRRLIKQRLLRLLHQSRPKVNEPQTLGHDPNVLEGTSTNSGDVDASCLELATTVFVCKRCRITIHYPQVMHHECLWSRSHWPYDSTATPQTWNIEKLMVVPSHGSIASSLVEACGLDPSITTPYQMDELNIFFRCRSCEEQRSSGMMNLSWRDALQHSIRDEGVLGSHHQHYIPLADDDLALARSRKEEFILDDKEVKWSCGICGHLPGSGSSSTYTKHRLENHLVFSHELPRDHPDFYENPGYVPLFGDLGDYEPYYDDWDDWDGFGLHYNALAEDILYDLFDYFG